MDATFSIALGNGLYMDSDGNILSTPVPNKPLYQPKLGLPISPDAVKKALDGALKFLPAFDDKGKPNGPAKFLQDNGISSKLINVLAKIMSSHRRCPP
jgi:hypothetical protein